MPEEAPVTTARGRVNSVMVAILLGVGEGEFLKLRVRRNDENWLDDETNVGRLRRLPRQRWDCADRAVGAFGFSRPGGNPRIGGESDRYGIQSLHDQESPVNHFGIAFGIITATVIGGALLFNNSVKDKE